MLPFANSSFSAAVAILMLHHLQSSELQNRAFAEIRRVLKPGGRLLLVDMLPHDREHYRQQMGHVWLGFAEERTRQMLSENGFGDVRVVHLPLDPKAKGPALFVATGRKQPRRHEGTKQIP